MTSFTRPSNTVRCTKCGKTGADKQGANNWVMCERCLVTYCSDCFRYSTCCGEHQPFGKWLKANGSSGAMTFK
jgi:hypothetical protein